MPHFRSFSSASQEVVDAEVISDPSSPPAVSKAPGRPGILHLDTASAPSAVTTADGSTYAISPLTEQRARAIVLFLKVPLLAAICLHPKVPAWMRLAAGALAAWEALQIAQQAQDLTNLLEQP